MARSNIKSYHVFVGPTMEYYRKTKEMMPHLIIILCTYQEPCARIQKEGVKNQIIVDNVVALIGLRSVYFWMRDVTLIAQLTIRHRLA
jgi:hypothetical protein